MGMEQRHRSAGATAPHDAVGGRRRGRPQRLPVDPLPSHDPAIDAVKRTAWLLATTRLLHPTTASMSRPDFIERLTRSGLAVDPPRLSRWESGSLAAPIRALDAYEQATGVPTGALTATHLMVQRYAGTPERLAEGEAGNTAALDAAFERVDAGDANGGDWLRLAQEITSFEHTYIHPQAWALLSRRLVNELTRAGGVAFLRRYEAAALLMRHPVACRYLSRSLGAFVMHPDVQNVTPALGLLSEVGDEAAGSLVLRLLQEPHQVLRGGAIRLAAAMASRGQLDVEGDGAGVLEAVARNELADPAWGRRTAALELVVRLPEASQDRLLSSLDDRVRQAVALAQSTSELVKTDVARRTADSVASHAESTLARSAQDPDVMLRKLVREGLFHVQRERRTLAASLIAASPYARGVAERLLALTRGRNPQVSEMSWSMLRRMAHVLDREELGHYLDSREERLRANAFLTLGLSRGQLAEETADRLLQTTTAQAAPEPLRYAATFALGMSGHGHISQLSEMAERTRRAGRWWLETGSALHDGDQVAAS